MSKTREFSTFKQFYPFYLGEHSNQTCRRLHAVGSALVLFVLGYAMATQTLWLLLVLPVVGYGFAWIGHFFFEKNRPATFIYPWYSFKADWVMFFQMLTGKIPF